MSRDRISIFDAGRGDEDDGDEGVEFQEEVRCIAETDRAICCVAVAGGPKVWVPQTCVHDESEVYGRGHVGKLIVKQWFAKKQGWV